MNSAAPEEEERGEKIKGLQGFPGKEQNLFSVRIHLL